MTSEVAVGDLIADKYRVERVLGRGGMGVVVAAVHVNLGQHVALKFLLPNVNTTPAMIARFEREARAAVALHSEHVTRVLDVGRLPDGAPFMVMEMLDGTDLGHELDRRKRLPAQEAVALLLQACDAIAEAHALGIIHRDIKPANLFLAKRPKREPIVKVLDFGISRSSTLTEGVADITSTFELIGSPLYMSPEQLRAPKTVDARSDIWSLGATLFELVSGEPPFDGETMAELSAHIMMTPLVGIRSREHGGEIPEPLADVLARCLEKDPDRRYATIDELVLALAPFARMESSAAAPATDPATTIQNPMATTASPSAPRPLHAGETLPLLPGPSVSPVSTGERSAHAISEAAVSYPPSALGPKPRRAPVLALGVVLAVAVVGIATRVLTGPASQPAVVPASPLPATSSMPSTSSEPAPSTIVISSTDAAAASPTASEVAGATSRAPVPRPRADARPLPITSASAKVGPSPSASIAPKGSASPLKLNLE